MSENNNNNNEIADQNPVPEKMKQTQFPQGLRVLAVDDDMTCLKTLAVMLQKCQYQVTETTKATEALDLLRKNKENYDIVITDVRMPDMDGFELLRTIGLEMDVPVIMMSANDDTSNVMKGVRHGARDYLVKPVRMLELKNIWQHVIRKTILNPNKSSVMTKEDMENLPLKKRRDRNMEIEEEEENNPLAGDSVAAKKPRFAWTKELHKKFVDAVQQLDAERAVPKKILEVMNEPQLTREIIASHLQKYRNFLKKQQDTTGEERTSNAGLNWAQGGVLDTTSSDNKVLSALGRANSSGEYSSSVDGLLSFRDQLLSRHDTVNTSLLNEGLMIMPLNQQNLLLQQNILSSRVADQVQPANTIPLLENVPSGPAWVTNPSRMMVDDYIDMSSQIPNFGSGQSGAPIGFTNFGTVQSRPPSFPGFIVRQPCPNKVPIAGLVSYPCPPGAFNIVSTPNHMLGNASTQISPISHPNSLPGQHEGRSLTVFDGRTGSDVRGWSTGTVNGQETYTQLLTDTIEIEDDDFNAALKQFGKTSAPTL